MFQSSRNATEDLLNFNHDSPHNTDQSNSSANQIQLCDHITWQTFNDRVTQDLLENLGSISISNTYKIDTTRQISSKGCLESNVNTADKTINIFESEKHKNSKINETEILDIFHNKSNGNDLEAVNVGHKYNQLCEQLLTEYREHMFRFLSIISEVNQNLFNIEEKRICVNIIEKYDKQCTQIRPFNRLEAKEVREILSYKLETERKVFQRKFETNVFYARTQTQNNLDGLVFMSDQNFTNNFSFIDDQRLVPIEPNISPNYLDISNDLFDGDFKNFKIKSDDPVAEYSTIMEENIVFSIKNVLTRDDLIENHENTLNTIMNKYNNLFDYDANQCVDNYGHEFMNSIHEKFSEILKAHNFQAIHKPISFKNEINGLIKKYENLTHVCGNTCDSEEELWSKNCSIEASILNEFCELNPFDDSSYFQPYLLKLKSEISKSFNDVKHIFYSYICSLNTKISEAEVFYKNNMKHFVSKSNHIPVEVLSHYNESLILKAIENFQPSIYHLNSTEKFERLLRNKLLPIFNDFKRKVKQNKDLAIGIDLGTTNCCVAVKKDNGEVEVINSDIGERTTPSYVAFELDGKETVGRQAKDNAFANPRNTIFSVKRLIGRNFFDNTVQEDSRLWPFKVVKGRDRLLMIELSVESRSERKTLFPEEISAKVLKRLKENAEKELKCEIRKAVITVPAYFTDSQKEATKNAGKIAGLEVMRIVSEPTAAAYAYNLELIDNRDKSERKVLVYDFGGGTFDVAVLTIKNNDIRILSIGGDSHLGGDDIDHWMVQYCLKKFRKQYKIVVTNQTEDERRALMRLRNECEKCKCLLSTVKDVNIDIEHFIGGKHLMVKITREKFESKNKLLFEKTINIVKQTIESANLKPADMDDIILVGGTTRVLKIRQMLTEFFNGKRLNHRVNAHEAVAVGAAVLASILNSPEKSKQLLHTDVSPLSLGVEVSDGAFSVIIPRNTRLPASMTRAYKTTADYQSSVEIKVYEGEDSVAKNNILLGVFVVSGIPAAEKGANTFDVTFEIDDEGLFRAKTVIASAARDETIKIIEINGRLTEEEINSLTSRLKVRPRNKRSIQKSQWFD